MQQGFLRFYFTSGSIVDGLLQHETHFEVNLYTSSIWLPEVEQITYQMFKNRTKAINKYTFYSRFLV